MKERTWIFIVEYNLNCISFQLFIACLYLSCLITTECIIGDKRLGNTTENDVREKMLQL